MFFKKSQQQLPQCTDEDFIAPIVKLVVMTRNEILLNKIVSKKSSLRDVLKFENLNPEAVYIHSGNPLDVNQRIIDLIPQNVSRLTNVELILDTVQMALEKKEKHIFYERILKPVANPFSLILFLPNEFIFSYKNYSQETLEYFKLENFSYNDNSCCNTPKDLFISGGKNGTKDFWKINNIKTNIEKLKDLPFSKTLHSMIYIPKKYIYFIGGNSKDVFYYDEFEDAFNDWSNLNNEIFSPALTLVDNTFIYAFGVQKFRNKNDFIERTNLREKPKWEILNIKLNNLIFNMKNFGAVLSDDKKVYFLGGREEKGEKLFCFDIDNNEIIKCRQENFSLIGFDKNFYMLNDFNSALIPNLNEEAQIIIFNRKKKKFKKVKFDKEYDQVILSNDMSIKNDQDNKFNVIWKQIKNDLDMSFGDQLNMPQFEDLCKKNDEVENINSYGNIEEVNDKEYLRAKVEDKNDEEVSLRYLFGLGVDEPIELRYESLKLNEFFTDEYKTIVVEEINRQEINKNIKPKIPPTNQSVEIPITDSSIRKSNISERQVNYYKVEIPFTEVKSSVNEKSIKYYK